MGSYGNMFQAFLEIDGKVSTLLAFQILLIDLPIACTIWLRAQVHVSLFLKYGTKNFNNIMLQPFFYRCTSEITRHYASLIRICKEPIREKDSNYSNFK